MYERELVRDTVNENSSRSHEPSLATPVPRCGTPPDPPEVDVDDLEKVGDELEVVRDELEMVREWIVPWTPLEAYMWTNVRW